MDKNSNFALERLLAYMKGYNRENLVISNTTPFFIFQQVEKNESISIVCKWLSQDENEKSFPEPCSNITFWKMKETVFYAMKLPKNGKKGFVNLEQVF